MQKNSEDKQRGITKYILCGIILVCIVVIVVLALKLKGASDNEEEIVPTPSITESITDVSGEEPSEEKVKEVEATPMPTSTPTPVPTETPIPKPTSTPVPTATPKPTSTPAPTPLPSFNIIEFDGEKKMQAWSFVNVRDYPSKAGNKVGSLNEGDIVTILGQCEETKWYQIRYNDTVAYVSNGYIVEIGTILFSSFNPEEDIENLESYPEITYDRNWTDYEKECLAKLVMAEAEGDSLYVKTLIAFTVINRVQSKGQGFPDTIEEVILQHRKLDIHTTIYQYEHTYAPGGRYHWVEPNEDCWKAVEYVQNAKYDFSNGAMYYESDADNDSWNARNLEFVVEVNNTRFYK